MEQAPKKSGLRERAGNFAGRFHNILGGLAIAGAAAEMLTGIIVVRPEVLAFAGVAYIVVGEVIKAVVGGKSKAAAAPVPAHA